MSGLVVEKEKLTSETEEPLKLYVVWIDVNLGMNDESDWEMNSDPQPLQDAPKESRGCNAHGFPTQIALEGITPRSDGFFSNPETDV